MKKPPGCREDNAWFQHTVRTGEALTARSTRGRGEHAGRAVQLKAIRVRRRSSDNEVCKFHNGARFDWSIEERDDEAKTVEQMIKAFEETIRDANRHGKVPDRWMVRTRCSGSLRKRNTMSKTMSVHKRPATATNSSYSCSEDLTPFNLLLQRSSH